jgi:hypothetical protein
MPEYLVNKCYVMIYNEPCSKCKNITLPNIGAPECTSICKNIIFGKTLSLCNNLYFPNVSKYTRLIVLNSS